MGMTSKGEEPPKIAKAGHQSPEIHRPGHLLMHTLTLVFNGVPCSIQSSNCCLSCWNVQLTFEPFSLRWLSRADPQTFWFPASRSCPWSMVDHGRLLLDRTNKGSAGSDAPTHIYAYIGTHNIYIYMYILYMLYRPGMRLCICLCTSIPAFPHPFSRSFWIQSQNSHLKSELDTIQFSHRDELQAERKQIQADSTRESDWIGLGRRDGWGRGSVIVGGYPF